ncbi:MAG: hypothetical protein ACRBK7_11305 [Acidimicrobiales bacterium]
MSNSVFTRRSVYRESDHGAAAINPPANVAVAADVVDFKSHFTKPVSRPRWQTFRNMLLPGIGRNTTIDEAKDIFGPHNVEVTKSYTSLSETMRHCLDVPGSGVLDGDVTRIGLPTAPPHEMVDWCGFASWVSFSLGAFLMPERTSPALAMHPFWRRMVIGRLLPKLLTTEEWAGLAAGNLQIYREMKALYKLVFSFSGDSFADALAEADRRTDALWYSDDFKGTEATPADRYWARHAVKSLLLAAASSDRHEKSQLMLSASIALSAIEQRRADHQIDDFFEGMIKNRRWLPGILHKPALRFTVWVTTRWLTHFLLPDGFISVGRPLEVPEAENYSEHANSLTEITNPWARTALDAFYTEAQPESSDWTDYGQRMNFIAALFRTYQEVPEVLLFDGLPRPETASTAESLFGHQEPSELSSLLAATMPEADPPTL